MSDLLRLFGFPCTDWPEPWQQPPPPDYSLYSQQSAYYLKALSAGLANAGLAGLANATPPPRMLKVREIIAQMGVKWCLHPANRVKRIAPQETEFHGSRILTEWLRTRERA